MPTFLASLETPAHPGQHPLPFDPSLQEGGSSREGVREKGTSEHILSEELGDTIATLLVMTRELKGSASWSRPLEGAAEEVWLGSGPS